MSSVARMKQIWYTFYPKWQEETDAAVSLDKQVPVLVFIRQSGCKFSDPLFKYSFRCIMSMAIVSSDATVL